MKREIKFRAYHIPTKRMFDVFSWCKDCVFEDSEDGIGTSPTLPAEMKDCELMQFTGLKDIHGKKIFEGDILHITQHYGDDGDFMGEVKFNDESCAFEVEDNLEGYILGEFDYENCEIIGNIHEHPRLLEKGNY